MNTEKNILIANFLGFQETELGWFDNEEVLNIYGSNTFDDLEFDTNANWLIPVAKYITTYLVEYDSDGFYNEEPHMEALLTWSRFDRFDLNDLYLVIVNYIEWYNEKDELTYGKNKS